jgi:hypothetical protein
MPRIIANKHDLFRILRSEQRLRAIVALVFVVATGMMLLKCPGPLFQEVAKAPRFSPDWLQTSPMDADEQTVKLNQQAAAALAALKAKSVRVTNNR